MRPHSRSRHAARRRVRVAVASWTLGAAFVACGVGEVDLFGKACPCAEGFVCDTVKNQCVVSLSSEAPDTGPSDDADASVDGGEPPPPTDAGEGKVVVYNLRSTWITGNGVRWDWSAVGDASSFREYEVVTGPTAEDVRARSAATRTWKVVDRPELGALEGRAPGSAARPLPLWTVSDGHKTNATVFAQVIAYDKDGKTTETDVASARTLVPRASLTIYETAFFAGGDPDPNALAFSSTNPYDDGGTCLAFPVTCAGGVASCPKQIGVAGFTNRIADALANTDFLMAYVEIAIRGKAPPGAYSDVILALGGDACGAPCRMRHSGWSFGPTESTWRFIQVPLRVLRRNDGAGATLTFPEFQNRMNKVNGFFVSGTWSTGATVAIDSVTLRW